MHCERRDRKRALLRGDMCWRIRFWLDGCAFVMAEGAMRVDFGCFFHRESLMVRFIGLMFVCKADN